ncbi:MAG TPA: nicotinate phosphoribosyltransferase [Salinisphaeraceae bacterium]|nr:nicotinate phosphoribosyltransferase [Salinisphaeraceae bacterium]
MSIIRQFYGHAPALLTDLYQLTMACAHWHNGTGEREAVFHLFYRRAPFDNRFALACGLDAAIDYIQNFTFDEGDIDYLATLQDNAGNPLFAEGFLDYLRNFRFTGSVDAVPEGSAVFPHQPMLRVTAPMIQAQMLETPLLTLMNFPTLVATKAARIVHVAAGDAVLDFGLRKAQGADGGVTASRAAYIGGCAGSANVLAGKLFGIPVSGTHAHSWIMSFDSELDAFNAYADAFPDQTVFLVDTYNSIEGVRNAIRAGRRLRMDGHKLAGIRLDSGDLATLSQNARDMLDEAGFEEVPIIASSSLDEQSIGALKQAGAPIVIWAVGTRLTTGQPDAALDGVYKLGAIRADWGSWSYRMKLSDTPGKSSRPGVQQVRRYYEQDEPIADLLYDIAAPNTRWRARQGGEWREFAADAEHVEMLVPIFRAGELIYEQPDLEAVRAYAGEQFSLFAERPDYPVLVDYYLEKSTRDLHAWLAARDDTEYAQSLHPSSSSEEAS